MTNPIEEFGQEFLDSGLRGVEVIGVANLFQLVFETAGFPIEVREKKGKIYLIRKPNADSQDT